MSETRLVAISEELMRRIESGETTWNDAAVLVTAYEEGITEEEAEYAREACRRDAAQAKTHSYEQKAWNRAAKKLRSAFNQEARSDG